MKILFSFLLLFLFYFSYAQNPRANILVTGQRQIIDFSTTPPTIRQIIRRCSGNFGTYWRPELFHAAIADKEGKQMALMITKGGIQKDMLSCTSDSLNNFKVCEMLILPRPNQEERYDIVSTQVDSIMFEPGFPFFKPFNGFEWYEVEASTLKVTNRTLVRRQEPCNKVAATQHANGIDYWLVFHAPQGSIFRVFPYTSQGIELANEKLYNVGLAGYDKTSTPYKWIMDYQTRAEIHMRNSRMKFASNGRILLRLADWRVIEFYRFDNATGEIYCPQRINLKLAHNEVLHDLEISFNNQFVYFTTVIINDKNRITAGVPNVVQTWKLYQIDLFAEDIAASQVQITQEQGYNTFCILQRATDNKIYAIRGVMQRIGSQYFQSVGIINSPNVAGEACEYVPLGKFLFEREILQAFGLTEAQNMIGSYFTDETAPNYPFARPMILMPNAFTPNGDGINDSFVPIKIEGVTESSIRIYNTWGKEVYQGNDILSGWKAENVPVGTYYYTITYKGSKCDEQIFTHKGWVQVLR